MAKIAVAMSGGVDSSVVAKLLKDMGHDVVGITLKLWQEKDDKSAPGGCCSLDDVNSARRVCDFLRIRHYVLNMQDDFRRTVVDNFVKEYLAARTPNPCIVCNEQIKFKLMMDKISVMGFSYLATGHYGIVERDRDGVFHLKKGADERKDQSYVLYRLTQKNLMNLILPLGDFTKEEVRKLANDFKLPCANRPESQEICFVKDDYIKFLRSYVANFDSEIFPGSIKDENGKILGKHKGLAHYTIGQRSSLGLTSSTPLYVYKMDKASNTIFVGTKEKVFARNMVVGKLSWVAGTPNSAEFDAKVKIRRLHHEADAHLKLVDNTVEVEFVEPQPAITPGQAAVFYHDGLVVGGGVIFS